jgi:hypothetical protein
MLVPHRTPNAETPNARWSLAFAPGTGTLSGMNSNSVVSLCEICGAEVCGDGTVCQECLRAFASSQGGGAALETSPLDLRKYHSRMFPWEQISTQPRLICAHPVWLFLALGLVVLVLLLALVRTPLPSCWELSF